MAVQWPSNFPTPQLLDYQFQPDETIARTDMDAGLARQRRRFTHAPTRVKVRWKMPQAIFAYFESWYVFKAKGGAEWVNIRLANGQTFLEHQARFIQPYSAAPISADLWQVDALFEVREMDILDELQLDLTLTPGSGPLWITLSGRLNTFIHTDLPNDNW